MNRCPGDERASPAAREFRRTAISRDGKEKTGQGTARVERQHDTDEHYQHDALAPQQLAWRGTPFGRAAYSSRRAPKPRAPRWLWRLIGDDPLHAVTAVTIMTNEEQEIELALPHLKRLSDLKENLLSAPSCGNALPSYNAAKERIESELPHVKVTGFGIPLVG